MPVSPPIYQPRLPVFGGGGVTQIRPSPPQQQIPAGVLGDIIRGVISAQTRKRQQELEQKRFGLDKMLAEAQAQYYLGRAAQPALSPSQELNRRRLEALIHLNEGNLTEADRWLLGIGKYEDTTNLLAMIEAYTRILEDLYRSGASEDEIKQVRDIGRKIFDRAKNRITSAEKPPGTPIEEALKGAGALTTAPEKPVPPATTEAGEPLSWKQNIPPDEQLALLASYSQKDKDKAVKYLAEFAKKNPEKILEFYKPVIEKRAKNPSLELAAFQKVLQLGREQDIRRGIEKLEEWRNSKRWWQRFTGGD